MIIYFSTKEHTTRIANLLGEELKVAPYRIVPERPYSDDDLNWHHDTSRANKEQSDDASRPQLSGKLPDLTTVKNVYIGFPLWWGKAPRIIQTFLEETNLSSKYVNIFCTSGSSPIEPALERLEAEYPDMLWREAKRFDASADKGDIAAWVKQAQEEK